jgi:hypothetical protein
VQAEAGPEVPEVIPQKKQRRSNMKKLVSIASYIVLAAGTLSLVASAQENPAINPSKLVQIVRNATIQYQNISAATAAG